MEPFTAIVLIVKAVGVGPVIAALGGDDAVQDVASRLVDGMTESESDLGERLTEIEKTLKGLIARPYTIAIGAGLRAMADATAAGTDNDVRRSELSRARVHFTEAVAGATSALQTAVAERYLLLCAIGLSLPGASANARARFYSAITEAVLDLDDLRWSTKEQERQQRQGNQQWGTTAAKILDSRVRTKLIPAFEKQESVRAMITDLLHEVDLLSGRPTDNTPFGGPLTLAPQPFTRGTQAWAYSGFPMWRTRHNFQPPAQVRLGALTVDWRDLRLSEQQQQQQQAAAAAGADYWSVFDVDVEIRTDPALVRDLPIRLRGAGEFEMSIYPAPPGVPSLNVDVVLRAGESCVRLQRHGVANRQRIGIFLTLGHDALQLSPEVIT